MRTRFLVVAFFVFGAFGAMFAPGCSSQGEGERCDRNNGNDDCNDGLECVFVSGTGALAKYRCCPTVRSSSSSSECRGEITENDAMTPADTGADVEDTGTDGQTQDSGTDAPVDAPSDTGTDADAAG